MRTTVIVLTTGCNWNCPYCNVQDFGDYMVDTTKINQHLPYIKELIGDHNFVIAGGEIGIVPELTLVHFLRTLDKPVIINTNGMFMDRGYHKIPEIRKYISAIYYHVTDVPDGHKVEVHRDDELEILYGVVGNDIKGIQDFLTHNQDIDVSYIGLDSNFDNQQMDYVNLLFMARQFSNVNENALNQLEKYCLKYNHIHKYRKFCKSTSFSIDLSKEAICLCAFRNKQVDMPLNKENLKHVITETNVFKGDNNCDTCTRVCLDVDIQSNIRDILRKR